MKFRPIPPLMLRRVSGHSMLPVLPPGTIVWGWRWFGRLRLGQVVIFLHNNKEKIKRISAIDDNKIEVIGDRQSASTDSRQFGPIDIDQVISRVIWPRTNVVEADDEV